MINIGSFRVYVIGFILSLTGMFSVAKPADLSSALKSIGWDERGVYECLLLRMESGVPPNNMKGIAISSETRRKNLLKVRIDDGTVNAQFKESQGVSSPPGMSGARHLNDPARNEILFRKAMGGAMYNLVAISRPAQVINIVEIGGSDASEFKLITWWACS